MKYLYGFDCDIEKKCDEIGAELDYACSNEERAKEMMRIFNFDENTKADEISILDIIPGLGELLLGIPHEYWTKPISQMTEEDHKLYDEVFDKVVTIFTSNK